MKVIGITGGVGAGKSEVLRYIKERCNCRILIADEAAHILQEPGQPCYQPLIDLLGNGILQADGQIDRKQMAKQIFIGSKETLLPQVNTIVHPAVKKYILSEIEREKQIGAIDYFFIEAALLIEDGYVEICDELWYIYATQTVRAERLKKARGYSEEKIDGIMNSQSDEETFRRHCAVVIDNSGDLEETKKQLRQYLQ
ncbi:MAG TPA: dephospho-CoA kinase [Lachnospiraceae bacterium]|nr:dephospho-CoA kinase [Lachnospiraceae bacterium]